MDHTAPRTRRRPHAAPTLSVVALALLIAGCGGLPGVRAPEQADGAPAADGAGAPAPGQLAPPPEPAWRTTGEALGLNQPSPDRIPLGQAAPVFQPLSQDPVTLRNEVGLRCGRARVEGDEGALAPLVTDLYLSGVDPALGTEALILGDCGPLALIVREMVAQGGEQVVSSVVGRALFLGGPGAEAIIESAASAGLERNLAGLGGGAPAGAGAGPGRAGSLSYAMAYFPSRAAAEMETADAVNTLYSNATPGYGIYTFVLLGPQGGGDSAGGSGSQSGADAGSDIGPGELTRYDELMRVIETYVLAADEGSRAPSPYTHAFLVAVHPELEPQDLAAQTGSELSAPIRRDFSRYLEARGEASLARRLETRPGPFLISSLEPRLLPSSAVSPRLVVDLSDIGGEYMYAVVDAYDRPVPAERAGRPESLDAVRERLLGLFTRSVPPEDLDARIADAWVFRVGRPPAGSGSEVTAEAPAEEAPGAAEEAPTPGPRGATPSPGEGGPSSDRGPGYQRPQVRGT